MGRIQSTGFELSGTGGSAEGYGFARATDNVGLGRRGGRCHVLSGYQSGVAAVTTSGSNFDTQQQEFWLRFYLYVDTLPGPGGLRIIGGRGSGDSASEAAWYLVLTSAGTIDGYNDGADARTKIATGTASVKVGQWYRINVHVRFRDRVGNNSNNLSLSIDGGQNWSVSTTGALSGGLNFWTVNQDTSTATTLGTSIDLSPFNATNAERDGGFVRIDDLVVDNAFVPGAGGVTLLHVTGQGTDNGWTTAGDWRSVVAAPPRRNTPLSNTTLSAATSFTLETMASKGLSGVAIKSVRICFHGRMIRNNWNYRLRINSTVINSGLQTAGIEGWITKPPGDPGNGTSGGFVQTDAFPISASDVLEIGLVDGAAGAGTSYLYGAYLVVDWEGADPATALVNGAIKTVSGTYVGNGTSQAVAFADPTFKPTLLFIAGENTGADHRVIWADGWGTEGDGATPWANSDSSVATLVRATMGSFSVKGGASSLNQSAQTYRYFAVRDEAGRFTRSGMRPVNTFGGAGDNWDVPLDVGLVAPSFRVDALLSYGQFFNPSNQVLYRDTFYVGDSCSSMNTNVIPSADGIQSLGTNVFQLGKNNTIGGNCDTTAWLAMSNQASLFTLRRLLTIGTYTGNGAGARVIAVAGLDVNPSFLFVVPESTGLRYYRYFADGAGANSRDWINGNSVATAITAFSTVAQFSVDSTLNVLGVVYHYVMFGEGDDPSGVPPEGLWHEFLVCGHAVKSIDSWYVGGVRQEVASAEGSPTDAYFLVPGYSAWNVAFPGVTTVTINGHRYTVIYLKEGGTSPLDVEAIRTGDTPLTLNVQGVEDVGDGSGALVTNAMSAYRHAMQNWVLGNYQAGAWLPSPTFPDSELVSVIDEASFTAADAAAQLRLPGGYVIGGAVGLDGNFVTVRDFVRQLNASFDVDSGLNRRCQFFVSMIDDSVSGLTPQLELSDVADVLRGSFEVDDDFAAQFNIIPYRLRREYVSGADPEWRLSAEARSGESIANYEGEFSFPVIDMHMTRDLATAADIATRKLLRHKDPPRRVKFRLAAPGLNLEIGDMRALTHFGGIGPSGWSRVPVRIHQLAANLADNTVSIEGYDMSRLFSTVFILGDEGTLNPAWTTATLPERVYGYLADEVTGDFSNGDPGKRVR